MTLRSNQVLRWRARSDLDGHFGPGNKVTRESVRRQRQRPGIVLGYHKIRAEARAEKLFRTQCFQALNGDETVSGTKRRRDIHHNRYLRAGPKLLAFDG